jgi:hypothetical protein
MFMLTLNAFVMIFCLRLKVFNSLKILCGKCECMCLFNFTIVTNEVVGNVYEFAKGTRF